MRSVVRFLAADGGGSAGVNRKFKVQNWELDASAVEAIPIGRDDVDDAVTDFWSYVEADDEVLGEFREVTFLFPDMYVGADIDERFWRVANSFPILLEFEYALVDVVAIVHRNVFVNRLWAPDFRRDFDYQSSSIRGDGWRGGRSGGRSSWSIRG
jgi:hypothetical protein